MDQELWNLLFSGITEKQCFIPEGCSPPIGGLIIYFAALVLVIMVAYVERDQLMGTLWRK